MTKRFSKIFLLFVAVAMTTACAIPLGKGRVLYPMGRPEGVLVTNATRDHGDLFRNGDYLVTIGPGEEMMVNLSFFSQNSILTFKTFVLVDGKKALVGLVSRDFWPRNGSYNELQSWEIRRVSPVRR
jgi:hypothetical protein